MSRRLALAVAVATLSATAALAEPASDAKPPPEGATVSGVTVTPSPRKACAPKDKACIALVVADLKRLYPEQLKAFCFQQDMTALRRDQQANAAGWCDSPIGGASAICSHYVPPAVKQACAPDRK
ncbi:MAG: hypothetical protein JSR98_07185 [Proteobacteria bacterium]|nr:hypothetical protein [Pseudomonadota bacterium]